MEEDILFKEVQKFNQWWFKLLLIAINLFFFYGIYSQLFVGRLFGATPMSDIGIIFVTLVTLAISILLLSVKLKTLVKQDGIYFRFYPIQKEFKYYAWDEVEKCHIREYSPLKEFGGWGWRISVLGKGIAYTVSGKHGLQLKLKNKKKILIGTNQPHQLKTILVQLGKHPQ